MRIEAYAELMAELADAGPARRGAVLARHGLDEAGWAAVDMEWQARLSEAMAEDGDGAPALLTSYARAYEAAQRAFAPPLMLEEFAEVTRLLAATGDLTAALAKVGVTLPDYLRGSEHWARRLIEDPDVEARFEAALRRR